jgi:AcrR family transcriptional regulator
MQAAALELFAEQGFDKTTVVDIAARAGVTRRTFSRHFADKRDVLFSGSVAHLPESALIEAVSRADTDVAPLHVISSVIGRYDWGSLGPRSVQRRRRDVIAATPELKERELLKYEAVASAFAGVLRQRGVDDATARLTADVGVAVFRCAYDRWLDSAADVGMGEIVEDVVAALRRTTAAAVDPVAATR